MINERVRDFVNHHTVPVDERMFGVKGLTVWEDRWNWENGWRGRIMVWEHGWCGRVGDVGSMDDKGG